MDFKLSRGRQVRVLVETKLNTNTRLVHGYEVQLREYQRAESTRYGIYLVIDVGGPDARIKALLDRDAEAQAAGGRRPTIFLVDGKPKEPASKYRRARADA